MKSKISNLLKEVKDKIVIKRGCLKSYSDHRN